MRTPGTPAIAAGLALSLVLSACKNPFASNEADNSSARNRASGETIFFVPANVASLVPAGTCLVKGPRAPTSDDWLTLADGRLPAGMRSVTPTAIDTDLFLGSLGSDPQGAIAAATLSRDLAVWSVMAGLLIYHGLDAAQILRHRKKLSNTLARFDKLEQTSAKLQDDWFALGNRSDSPLGKLGKIDFGAMEEEVLLQELVARQRAIVEAAKEVSLLENAARAKLPEFDAIAKPWIEKMSLRSLALEAEHKALTAEFDRAWTALGAAQPAKVPPEGALHMRAFGKVFLAPSDTMPARLSSMVDALKETAGGGWRNNEAVASLVDKIEDYRRRLTLYERLLLRYDDVVDVVERAAGVSKETAIATGRRVGAAGLDMATQRAKIGKLESRLVGHLAEGPESEAARKGIDKRLAAVTTQQSQTLDTIHALDEQAAKKNVLTVVWNVCEGAGLSNKLGMTLCGFAFAGSSVAAGMGLYGLARLIDGGNRAPDLGRLLAATDRVTDIPAEAFETIEKRAGSMAVRRLGKDAAPCFPAAAAAP